MIGVWSTQRAESRYSDSLGSACGMRHAPAEECVCPHGRWEIFTEASVSWTTAYLKPGNWPSSSSC